MSNGLGDYAGRLMDNLKRLAKERYPKGCVVTIGEIPNKRILFVSRDDTVWLSNDGPPPYMPPTIDYNELYKESANDKR